MKKTALACYEEAAVIGERLRELLRLAEAASVDEIEALVVERGRLVDQAGRRADGAGPPEPIQATVMQLLAQQEELEHLMAGAVAVLREEQHEQAARRGSLREFRRLLQPGARSRELNEMR